MIITAVTVGTRGDVEPLTALGQECLRRGHTFRMLAQEQFRPLIESKGIPYLHLDGDAERVMQYLVTDYKGSLDFMKGMLRLWRENPRIMEQTLEAVRGSNLVMYGLCAGFAYHACELLGIPCARLFYSPFDRTNMYSLYDMRHNTPAVGRSYAMIEPGMNLLTCLTLNAWRRSNGLPKWRLSSDYRALGGRRLLTFYPVSPLLMPPDPAWPDDIHVTGFWYHPEEEDAAYVPDAGLDAFLRDGEPPIFVGFGKAVSEELVTLQRRVVEALRDMRIRAVVQADQLDASERENTDHLYFIGGVPYSWLFPRVRAVVHHGGCTTNGLGLWAGRPTLIIPLALDQYYYGRTIHELGLGPAPLYIRKRLCTTAQIKAALAELTDERYARRAAEIAARIRVERGCETAADCIERYLGV